jgi:putative tricarboxylic transport membrane protein
LLGLGLLALAGVLAWQTTLIPTAGAYARIGPTGAPWLVTALLALLGLSFIATASFAGKSVGKAPDQPDRSALIRVFAALSLNLMLIPFAGFIIATSVLFAVTAQAFGSTRPGRDAAIGFALASIAYVTFDRLLGYSIGGGLVEQFL